MSTITPCQFGQLPAVQIRASDGAAAIVTLFGAHLVSWNSADGQQRLFCSSASPLDGSAAIRGGVPVIFPQFAARGDGMRHGFARVSQWRVVGQADGYASFELTPADLLPAHAAAWPHQFKLTLTIALDAQAVTITLEVHNAGDATFAFSSALHTYFAVPELAAVTVGGVEDTPLMMADHIDRIYQDLAGPLTISTGQGALRLEQSGFVDAVVWNPGAQDAAALADMDDEEYRRFVCVEAALIDPLTLAPGTTWRGEHCISILK